MKNKYMKNVNTLKVNPSKCIGCNMCVTVCPHEVFELVDKKVTIINLDDCIECGACAKNCPKDIINVNVGVGCASAVLNSMFSQTTT